VAVPIDNLLAHVGKISRACDITGHARGVAADVGYAGSDRGEGGFVSAVECDPRACPRERDRDGCTDPSGAACDKSHPILEGAHFPVHLSGF
jgi:hypothetical protein